jgi:mercury(II) reductase
MMDDCCASRAKRRDRSYDIAVIGAGSAGFSAAITAAEQGAQVALIGHGAMGGTCVNVGCVPSKALIRAAQSLHDAHSARRFAGLSAEGRLEDWRALVSQKDELVAGLKKSKYVDLLPAYETISYIEGRARLDEGGVSVNGDFIKAERSIITTGARPAAPSISGLAEVEYLTSASAMSLESLPRSLIVVGGGYVGAELAQMFARVGVIVTIVCRSRLLPKAEPEVSEALAGYFRDEGIELHCGVAYQNVQRTKAGVTLTLGGDGGEQVLSADRLLVAAGRTPNVEGLGLDDRGVALAWNGGVRVDDRMRTTRAGVYAAGDVTGRDEFVYMAAHGAKIAAKNALNGDSLRYDNAAMPRVVFTDPHVASVGMTEAEARAAGHQALTSVLPVSAVPRALAARDTRGLIKLVADQRTRRLIGAHILAPEGADSVQTAALAIRQGFTIDDLADVIFPYLTTVEGLKLAALAFAKDLAKLSCCAG